MPRPYIVGIGGTTRAGSTTERLVASVLEKAAEAGAETALFGGNALASLPHFAPENAARTDAQRDFVEAVRMADGIVIGTPGYHGGISGLVKNAIDLLEDLRDDNRPYFEGRAVALIVSAAGWQAGGATLAALRGVTHAMRGWPTPLGIAVNSVEQKIFSADGLVADAKILGMIEEQARQVMRFVGATSTGGGKA